MAALSSRVGVCGTSTIAVAALESGKKTSKISSARSVCGNIGNAGISQVSLFSNRCAGASGKHLEGRKSRTVVLAAEKTAGTATEEEVVDQNILQYCELTKGPKKTLGEMEQEFLLALQSFYVGQAPIMSNEEFDNLKEELLWEGSTVVVLSPAEQKFMEASLAYQSGKPFLSDKEYDQLKVELKKQNSKVAIEGPRCSLRSRKMYSDTTVDYLRMTLLNLPAALVALGVVFFLDDITGFEITYLLELPEPYSFIFTWFIVLPATYLIAQTITNYIFRDFLILNGPCPSCGVSNVSFFGTILTVANNSRTNDVKCESCGSILRFDVDNRTITLEALPGEKPSKPAKA